ncbi:MAG: HAD-IA family hydrolase [Acidobacteria bacterium]|nr:HAD-IA family hydrolase [Acidobacteriota bacterium]
MAGVDTGTESFACDAILFDMDGTLVDSTAPVERQWRLWAERRGLDAERVLAVAHGRRTIETMRDVAPHLNIPDEEAVGFDEAEGLDAAGVVPVAGAAPLLAALPRERWAVVTSAGDWLARMRFAQSGLPLPDVLVTGEDVREGKPHPGGYLLAARRLGVPGERCLVIEDTPAGIGAGLSAGMRVLAIGNTVPRESLPPVPWIPDLTHLRLAPGDGSYFHVAVKMLNS